MVRRLGAALGAVLALAGCGVTLTPDPQAFEVAQEAYRELAAGEDQTLVDSLPAETHTPTSLRTLRALREMLPDGKPKPGKLVGWRNTVGTGGNQAMVIVLYDYGSEQILETTQLRKAKAGSNWNLTQLFIRGATPQEAAAPVFLTGTISPPAVVRKEPAG